MDNHERLIAEKTRQIAELKNENENLKRDCRKLMIGLQEVLSNRYWPTEETKEKGGLKPNEAKRD